jgi:hypothetical protein
MEVNRHVILDRPYQGDGIWVFFVLFSIFVVVRILLGARRKRNAGQSVDVRTVIVACLFFLGFCALGLFQLLSHH